MSAEFLIQLIQQHGFIALIAGVVLEEIIVPLPSPVVPMAAGAILIESSLNPIQAGLSIFLRIAVPASVASVASSYFVYSIAFFGGKPGIERFGNYLGLSWEDLTRFESHFDSGREGYYVAVFRAIPIVPLSLISGSAGLFRMDWRRYGFWSFVGMVPRNFFLAYLGWSFRDSFAGLAARIDSFSTAVLLGVAVLVVGLIAHRKLGDIQKEIYQRL